MVKITHMGDKSKDANGNYVSSVTLRRFDDNTNITINPGDTIDVDQATYNFLINYKTLDSNGNIISFQLSFVNREEELTYLRHEYSSNQFRFIVVTGRRRVGKTFLISHFLKDKSNALYIYVPEEDRLSVRLDVARKIGEKFGLSFVGSPEWSEIFEKVFLYSKKNRATIVFDEFQRFSKIDPSVFSHLQNAIDANAFSSRLFLVTMGSSIGMMDEIFQSEGAPLLGRKTGTLKLPPFSFKSTRQMLGLETQLAIRYYNFFGGTPAYISRLDLLSASLNQAERMQLTVSQDQTNQLFSNINRLMLSNRGPLYEEAESLLKEELSEPKTYFDILRYIATGKNTPKEIADMLSINATSLSHFFDVLGSKLDLIARKVPVTENPLKSKSGRYFIKDNYFAKWFRYVFQNKSELELGNSLPVLNKIKTEESTLLGRTFEQVCEEALRELAGKRSMPEFEKLGQWWERDIEIDLMALNESKKEILFGECKWKDRVDALAVLSKLKEKSENVAWNRKNRKERFVIFAKTFEGKSREKVEKEALTFDIYELDKLFK